MTMMTVLDGIVQEDTCPDCGAKLEATSVDKGYSIAMGHGEYRTVFFHDCPSEKKDQAQPPRYSLDEIDRMRAALNDIKNHRVIGGSTYGPFPTDSPSRVEDELRTYLVGGVRVEELESKAAASKAEWEAAVAKERENHRKHMEAVRAAELARANRDAVKEGTAAPSTTTPPPPRWEGNR